MLLGELPPRHSQTVPQTQTTTKPGRVAIICDAQPGIECSIVARAQSPASNDEPKGGALRHAHRVPAVRAGDLRVGVAESPEEIEAAGGLVRRRYAWRGYDVDAVDDRRAAGTHDRWGQEITFVAANRNTTIGTLTLGLDGPFGLRAEESHSDVIETMRAAGRRVCELTRLALAESVDSKPVLASLFSLAYAAGFNLHGVTDVVIEVNPRHVGFYSRVLGFVVAAGEGFCERVRAPSVLLHVEVEALAARLEALAWGTFGQPMLARAA